MYTFLFFLLTFQLFISKITGITYTYDKIQSEISVYLSGAAYCDKQNYSTMILAGPAKEYVYEALLYDIKTDLQGFIGYISAQKTIYISLRGSSSKLNWMDDLEVKQVEYETFNDCNNCKVHYGFYRSVLGIKNKTIEVVSLLKKRFPLYSIIMTGHSYGASTTQLLGMELEKAGFQVSIYNFGQPRVGNNIYANYANTIIKDYWRFTHWKDVVPHLPPQTLFGYLHSCREVFEDQTGKLSVCSEVNCEDPTGSDQFPLYKTNSDDHLVYLGHRVSCEESISN